MKHLKITNQCHENWNDFTPTQQGAFCQKCKIDVKDFTQMTNNEIKDYLESNSSEHLCGRLYTHQIDGFNTDSNLWSIDATHQIQSKFIFVLLVTFGLTLFSCSTETEKYQLELISKNINLPTLINDKGETIQNDTLIDHKISSQKNEKSDSNKIVYEAPIIDVDASSCGGAQTPVEIEGVVSVTMGVMIYRPPIDTVLTPIEDTTEIITSNNIDETTFDYKLFPNPTIGETNLIIDVKQDDYFLITLVDLNGNVLQEILNGELMVGEQRFFIDLNDYSSGYYLIYVQTKNINESIKILKTD